MTKSSLRLLLAIILSLPLLSCGSGNTTTQADTSAGITFQLKWPTAKTVASAPSGVATVRISVSAADMATVNMDFSASAGSGSLPGVTPGSGRTISIVGLDASSVITHSATVSNVPLSSGQIYNCGVVTMTATVTALATAPTLIMFANTDSVGSAKTATISGGFSPYTVSSAFPSDIGVTISGSTVTISKQAPGSTYAASTTITVTDSKNNTTRIPVGYFK